MHLSILCSHMQTMQLNIILHVFSNISLCIYEYYAAAYNLYVFSNLSLCIYEYYAAEYNLYIFSNTSLCIYAYYAAEYNFVCIFLYIFWLVFALMKRTLDCVSVMSSLSLLIFLYDGLGSGVPFASSFIGTREVLSASHW